MSFDTDLRAFLLAQSAISTPIGGARLHQNHVPESYGGTYLWIGRSGIGRADTLDMTPADNVDPWQQRFDAEAISENQADAMDLASAIESLHGYRGSFGTGTIQGVFCEDQVDGYVARGVMSDLGLDVGALVLTFIGYAPP